MRTRGPALLALVLALASCGGGLKPADERKIQRWLLCEECTEGELDSVLALGSRGEDALKAAVRGPPADGVNNIRLQTEAMYGRIPSPIPGLNQQKYVEHFVANYKATYVRRAIVALARLNTPTAHAALIDALRHDTLYRADVRRLLGESAGTVALVVAGDSQHAPVDSFVRVNPIIEVRDTVSPVRPLSSLRVVFRVESGGGRVTDSLAHTDSSGRATVRWRLGPTDSVNVLAVVVAGRTLRLRAFGHPYGLRVVFLVQPSNGTRGQPLTPAPRIAVQDAWGALQQGFNRLARVTVVPLSVSRTDSIVGGELLMSGLSVPQAGTGFTLRVIAIGVAPGFSARFDIAP